MPLDIVAAERSGEKTAGLSFFSCADTGELDQLLGRRWDWSGAGKRFESLRRTPIIDHRYLLRARDRAPWGAMLLGLKLAAAVCDRVLFEGNAGVATLLRAPVHQPVLTNIQVA